MILLYSTLLITTKQDHYEINHQSVSRLYKCGWLFILAHLHDVCMYVCVPLCTLFINDL